jgi:acetyltransferase-like isoleucine patch superfamily enzyme
MVLDLYEVGGIIMIKNIIRSIIYGHKSDSNKYIAYLRKLGVKIGENCMIYTPTKTLIDLQYPWMIEIGDNVQITQGVIILTHDYSWSVLKHMQAPFEKKTTGAILGAAGKVHIGNDVFIGMNTLILRNVNIGDKVIIGAGSTVTRDCESNSVYAGNPARKIMTIEEYYEKRYQAQLQEAKDLAVEYYKRFNKLPDEKVFHEFFMLFEADPGKMCDIYIKKLKLTGNYDESINYMKSCTPRFKNFDEFLKYCFPNKL